MTKQTRRRFSPEYKEQSIARPFDPFPQASRSVKAGQLGELEDDKSVEV